VCLRALPSPLLLRLLFLPPRLPVLFPLPLCLLRSPDLVVGQMRRPSAGVGRLVDPSEDPYDVGALVNLLEVQVGARGRAEGRRGVPPVLVGFAAPAPAGVPRRIHGEDAVPNSAAEVAEESLQGERRLGAAALLPVVDWKPRARIVTRVVRVLLASFKRVVCQREIATMVVSHGGRHSRWGRSRGCSGGLFDLIVIIVIVIVVIFMVVVVRPSISA